MNYKLLGNSGLRVSEVALGTMTFGKEWGWGSDKIESKKVFDTYANAGGNFIDTANFYTEGTSEKFLADFIAKDRDHFVLGTKYTLFDKENDLSYSGNSRKNMMRSVEDSLKRLNTEYIDVFWLHAWDFTTPIDEVMRAFDDLVSAGKVNYIGISDTPAWIVSRANTLAELKGWTQFVGLQIEYSLLERTAERDLIPMAKEMGLAVTPWSPLSGGVLTGKYLTGEAGRIKEEHERRGEKATEIVKKVVDVANEMEVSAAQLALRWSMQKEYTSIPIVGGTSDEQLKDSLRAVDINIPENLLKELNEVSKIDLGFPHSFLNKEGVVKNMFSGMRDHLDFD